MELNMHDTKPPRRLLATIWFRFTILMLSSLIVSTSDRLNAQGGEAADPPRKQTKEAAPAPKKPADKTGPTVPKQEGQEPAKANVVTADKPAADASSGSPATPAESGASAALQRDPLKQLSRQYARRKSAKNRDDQRAPTPPTAEEIREPVLAFSQGHRETCIAFAGDVMPEGTLPDGEGKLHVLRESLGKNLTVIVCWNADNPYALDQFQEIRRDVLPLAETGVQAIAIHVGTPPADYAELCRDSGAGVLCLVDADGKYFNQLASRMLPRTYVVDATGKILWLDVEYSRSTRYDLRNALHYYLPPS